MADDWRKITLGDIVEFMDRDPTMELQLRSRTLKLGQLQQVAEFKFKSTGYSAGPLELVLIDLARQIGPRSAKFSFTEAELESADAFAKKATEFAELALTVLMNRMSDARFTLVPDPVVWTRLLLKPLGNKTDEPEKKEEEDGDGR